MGVYSRKIKLRYSDIGRDNALNLKSLIGYLQEMAGAHSSKACYGLNDMSITHVTWLLLDWKVKMLSHPCYGEELTVNTWPRSFEKCYSYRDFEIFDSNNNLVAIASSKWLLINCDTKRIERITSEIANSFGIVDRNVFEDKLDEKPKAPDNLTLNFKYKIQRRDIDTNGHVNNLHYIDYALETLPENVYNNNEFDNIEINFKKEIKSEDTINCYYSFENNKHIVTIKSEDDSILHSIVKFY